MSDFLIVQPLRPVAIDASRGSGVASLLASDPKEVWADVAVDSPATIHVDLGVAIVIDTVFLGFIRAPSAGATWTIDAGVGAPGEATILPTSALRVPDVPDDFAATTHALYHGPAQPVRFLRIHVTQSGGQPLTIGTLVIGRAFAPALGQEWGLGRQLIDTGIATALPSGGFAVVEGARKRLVTWTFGDLSIDEADRLELIALALGQTSPALVVEDAQPTTGLRARCHYGLFRWRAFERRNRAQTRWEMEIEEWI